MATHQQTLSLIRDITSDGRVTDEEVVTLATFLNEHREARKSWPGVAVFQILKDILADGRIDDVERRSMQVILEGIEIICAGAAQAAKTTADPPSQPKDIDGADGEEVKYEASKLTLPGLELEQVQMRIEDPKAARHLVQYSCDCDNWADSRSNIPESSPGRACRCIVNALHELLYTDRNVAAKWSKSLVSVIRHARSTGRGLDPVDTWQLLKLENTDYVISVGKTDWCNVYESVTGGDLVKFSYHRGHHRWGHGVTPRAAKSLEKILESGLNN